MTGLELEGVTVSYGGVTAVNGVTLDAPLGAITGLIGPNGAGKTSTFNACSGIVQPSSGSIRLFGRDVTHAPVGARARAGLGRTFQTFELCNAVDVRTNVSLGIEARLVGGNPIRNFALSKSHRAEIRSATTRAIETCGISSLADAPTASLSTGQRRLVELARAIAGGYKMMLLDEPSSGLDEHETADFGTILRGLVADGERGILLVEHDMSLVMSISDYIYVLDFGELIFSGTPAQTQRDEQVRRAYLGYSASQDPVSA